MFVGLDGSAAAANAIEIGVSNSKGAPTIRTVETSFFQTIVLSHGVLQGLSL